MRVAKDNFYCSNNFLLLQLNSDGIDDDNIQSLGHGQCVVEWRELFTVCKIPPLRWNFAWGAKYLIPKESAKVSRFPLPVSQEPSNQFQ